MKILRENLRCKTHFLHTKRHMNIVNIDLLPFGTRRYEDPHWNTLNEKRKRISTNITDVSF